MFLAPVGHTVVCAIASLLLVPAVRGQCATQFLPGDGFPGANNYVHASVLWDPDGGGPDAPRLVIGGAFQVVGTAVARGVACQDLASGVWTALGAGIEGEVVALAVAPNGTLFAAANPGATAPGRRVMAWNGTTWVQIGLFDFTLRCLVALPNGDLLAGGDFANVGLVPAARLARWDGSVWSAFGAGVNGPVRAMTVMPNGDAVIGGTFGSVDGQPINGVARWNGSTWSGFGTGISPAGIDGAYALAVLPGGDLVAAGFFPFVGGVPASNIARWDGGAWNALGTGLGPGLPTFAGSARSVIGLANGDVVVGGVFSSAGGAQARSIARWNGTAWSPVGPGFQPFGALQPASVSALVQLPDGSFVAGGNFVSGGGQFGDNVSRWDGIAWRPVASGLNGSVFAIADGPAGDIIVGGSFTVAGGVSANRLARWDGAAWAPIGSGANGNVQAALTLPNGDAVVAGSFTVVDGVTANRVARWDGVAWSAMGTGMNGSVTELALLPSGDLIAGGTFSTAGGLPASRLARWTGTAWTQFAGGVSGTNASVTAIHVRPDGSVVVGGSFTAAGAVPANNMAVWDGAAWTALGSWFLPPDAITTALGGSLFACRDSTLFQWNAGQWLQVGSATSNMRDIVGLPGGDLIAVGAFDGIAPPFLNTLGIARWNGTGWSAVDGGLGNGSGRVVRVLGNGDVAIGGDFHFLAGGASSWFARLRSTCPATAVTHGFGCASSGGSNTLTATTLPWVDATFRASGTGLPALAIVVAATSVTSMPQGALPLASVLAEGMPGCDLLVAPDILQALVTANGLAESSLFLPNVPPLVGVTFFHQMVPFELDVQGSIVAITSTNALQLTAGTL